MKRLRRPQHLVLGMFAVMCPILMVVPCGCGGGGGGTDGGPLLDVTVPGGWSCAAGVDCQDVYDYNFTAGSFVRVRVTDVTGTSVVRVALFAPGDGLASTNMLTGINLDASCNGQNGDEDFQTIPIPFGGLHRLAICRDWGFSGGASGTYTLHVSADRGFADGGQTADDVPSQAAGFTSPCQTVIDSGWSCTASQSCQDVYDVFVPPDSVFDCTLTNITGFSVAMLAIYAPGVPLGGLNLLTGNTDDASCNAMDADESFTGIALVAGGVYRVAVTRDWDSSGGLSGNYRLTLTTNKWMDVSAGQTVDDVQTLATGITCPP